MEFPLKLWLNHNRSRLVPAALALISVLICFILLGKFAVAPALVNAQSKADSSQRVMMVTYHFQSYKESWWVDLSLARVMGFNVVRIDATWASIEPENGVFDFKVFDRFVGVVERSGVRLCVIISTHLYPDWVEPYLQGCYDGFITEAEDFTETVVKHIMEKYPHLLFAWQVENEPWEVDPTLTKTHLLPNKEKVLYLSRMADAIRKIDPNNPIVMTINMEWGVVLSGLTTKEKSMLLSHVDVLGLNLYPYWPGLRDNSTQAFQYLTQLIEDGLTQAKKYGKQLWIIELPIVPYYRDARPTYLEVISWVSTAQGKTSVIGIYQLKGHTFGILNFP